MEGVINSSVDGGPLTRLPNHPRGNTRVLRARVLGDHGTGDPEEAVATGDVVAGELLFLTVSGKADLGRAGVETVDAFGSRLEEDLSAGFEPGPDQVLDHFLLAVDRYRQPVGQVGEVDTVTAAVEAQFDPVVDGPLPLHPLTDADLLQQLGGAVLEHTCPDRRLQVFAAATLEHDGVDPLQVQQVREQEPCRPAPDDPYLRTHRPYSSSLRSERTRWATENAELAAGTPQ